jgi:hypothetical protein
MKGKPMLVYDIPPGINEFFDYVNSQYEHVAKLGPDHWYVYLRKSYEPAHDIYRTQAK